MISSINKNTPIVKKTQLSPAKLNLSLFVTGKTTNNYHTLNTIFQKISLFDTVTLCYQKKNTTKISVVVQNYPDLSNKKNICHKAITKFIEVTKTKGIFIVNIKKNIPIGAGLGGGSSNAGTVLLLLDKIFQTNYAAKISKRIGADVPFFTKDYNVANATRIGEKLKKIVVYKKIYYALLILNINCSTKEVFNKYDVQNMRKNQNTHNAQNTIKTHSTNSTFLINQTIKYLKINNVNKMTKSLKNDLFFPATIIYPKLKIIKNIYPLAKMTGSGSSFFIPFNNEKKAKTFIENDESKHNLLKSFFQKNKPTWILVKSLV